jgi:predicted transcriptional regulator
MLNVRLKEARKTAGLTQGAVATELVVGQSFLSKLERESMLWRLVTDVVHFECITTKMPNSFAASLNYSTHNDKNIE